LEALFPRAIESPGVSGAVGIVRVGNGRPHDGHGERVQKRPGVDPGLTLTANKIRQAAITKEISELVGGAEALQ
jgi:hypothetical protein